MDLLEEIKSSLERQSHEQGRRLYPSSYREYIDYSLTWRRTIEGFLFWNILNWSWYYHGIYDYITIIKLYHVFGRDVFKSSIHMSVYYRDYFDRDRNCLSDYGFEKLCKEIESYGINRVS